MTEMSDSLDYAESQSKLTILSLITPPKVTKPHHQDTQGHQESFAVRCENIDDVEEPRSSRLLPGKTSKKTGNIHLQGNVEETL